MSAGFEQDFDPQGLLREVSREATPLLLALPHLTGQAGQAFAGAAQRQKQRKLRKKELENKRLEERNTP